jgi:hypothetical protein
MICYCKFEKKKFFRSVKNMYINPRICVRVGVRLCCKNFGKHLDNLHKYEHTIFFFFFLLMFISFSDRA